MVRCPQCRNLTRYNREFCLECRYKFAADEIDELDKYEKRYNARMRLRDKLKIRSYRLEFFGVILMLLGITLLIPAFLYWFSYFKFSGYTDASEAYVRENMIKGIIFTSISIISFISSAICYYVRNRDDKKRKMLGKI